MHVFLQKRQQVRVAVEPMLDPLIQTMPDFNLTEFAARHGITIPDVFQSEKGWKPKHPIIIVPGFVTSGLELWAGQPCAAKYFRSTSPPCSWDKMPPLVLPPFLPSHWS